MNLTSILPFADKRNQIAPPDVAPFASLQREIDRVFADFTRGWPTLKDVDLTPRIDVTEKDATIRITAELPGLEEKDVEVTLADDVLMIKGEKKAETEQKDEKRHLIERSYGTFSRSLQLPAGTRPEAIKASMANGVLTITVPKPAEEKPEAKKIKIQAAA
jgi:HSP20 family protein